MQVIATVHKKIARTPIPEEGIAGRVVEAGEHNPVIKGITIEHGKKYEFFERAVPKRTLAATAHRKALEAWEDEVDLWEARGKKDAEGNPCAKPRKPKPPRQDRRGKENPIEIKRVPVTREFCQQLVEESRYLHEAGTPLVEFSLVGDLVAGPKAGTVPPQTPPPAGSDNGSTPPPGPKLNANTATAEQLQEISGIGAKIAEQIVARRESMGGRFESLSDVASANLQKLRVEKLEPFLTV